MVDPSDHDPAHPQPVPVDADVDALPARAPASPLAKAMLAVGSAALLAAMATDALAVAGRHAGIRLLGSIEIVQASIVLIATTAIVLTTIVDAHARVHILLERLPVATAARWLRGANALSALVFLWLAAGSAWLAADLWNGHELTEILQLPLRWLRLFWIMGAVATAILFARRAFRSITA
ncbi:MAG: TRAP transporter small permease subunit [Sphingomonas paucimobilis]